MKQKPTIGGPRRNNETTTKSNGKPKTFNTTMIPKEQNATINHKTIQYNRTKEGTVHSDQQITEKPPMRSSTTKEKERNKANKKDPLNIDGNVGASSASESSGVSSVGVGLIIFCLVIILVALCWFVYAYHHPQSRSGRFLIEVRHREYAVV